MKKFLIEKILNVNHWNKSILLMKISRNNLLKFVNGEFILLGLLINNKIIYKAYSITSSHNDKFLEFLSIKLKLGILTKNFFNIKKNFKLLISRKSSGTLNYKNLNKSNILFIICSGTGVAPILSILKEINIYKNYNNIFFFYSEKLINNLIYLFFFKKKIYFNKNKFNNLYFFFIITRELYLNNIKINDILIYEYLFNIINFKNLKFISFIICCNNNNIKNINYILTSTYNFKLNKEIIYEKSFLNF